MHLNGKLGIAGEIQGRVRLCNNVSEVVREALRLMHQRDEAQRARYAQFKREAVLGYEQGQRGEFTTRTPEEIAQAVEDRRHASQS